VPFSSALLGGFAIGAWVSLIWQHSAECEMSASLCSLYACFCSHFKNFFMVDVKFLKTSHLFCKYCTAGTLVSYKINNTELDIGNWVL